MGTYKALSRDEFDEGEYTIVPMRKIDIFEIKRWRNEQIDILRQRKILTDQDQEHYYEKHVVSGFSEERPEIILFSFLQHETCIGYGGLTNIDWENKRAEVSFLLRTERSRKSPEYGKDFAHFLRLIKKVAFDELALNRIFTETFDLRPDHVRVLEENGFTMEGRLQQHVLIHGRFVDSLIHGCLRDHDRIRR